jgi:hypothetical protein
MNKPLQVNTQSILLFLFLFFSNTLLFAQANLFSVFAENQSLKEVLFQMQKDYDVEFSANNQTLNKCNVTDSSTYVSIETCMASLLKPCNLSI